MNAAFLLMASASLTGYNPAGCDGCVGPVPMVAPCDPCASSPGLLSRLRSRMGGLGHSSCDPCGSSSPGLLARLRARCHKSNDCCAPAPCSTPDCGGAVGPTSPCALPPVPGTVMYPPSSETPQMMPMTPAMPGAMPGTTTPKPVEVKPKATPADGLPRLAPKKVDLDIPAVVLPSSGPVVPF